MLLCLASSFNFWFHDMWSICLFLNKMRICIVTTCLPSYYKSKGIVFSFNFRIRILKDVVLVDKKKVQLFIR